jgi:hypothetical protein
MERHVAWFKATAAPITVTDKPPLRMVTARSSETPVHTSIAKGVGPHKAATCQVIATGTSPSAFVLPICIVYLLTEINIL